MAYLDGLDDKPHTLAFIELAGATLAGVWWIASDGRAESWPLILVLAPLFVSLLAGRSLWQPTPLDLPLLLFLATTLMGVWAAYDTQTAWHKFWLVVGAFALFYALARQPRRNLWSAIGVLGSMGVLIAVYFLLTHDWQVFPVKFPLVTRVGTWWMSVRPEVSWSPLHPNIMGGLTALLLPYILAFGLIARRRGQLLWLVLAAVSTAIAVAALILSASRGATLALVVAFSTWALWNLSQRLGAVSRLSQRQVLVLLLFPVPVVLMLVALRSGGLETLFGHMPGAASGMSRLTLARQTTELIGDFPYTGGGLGSFPGLYSHYILVIPFYFLPNGHNVFLDVALEQGLLGMLAFSGICLGAFWLLARGAPAEDHGPGDYDLYQLRWAAAGSLIVMLVHGTVEDTVYGSSALPLLFSAPGLAVALNRATIRGSHEWRRGWRWSAVTLATSAVIVIFSLITLPSWRANWYANLGAVRMARVELSQWPTDKWSDGSEVELLVTADELFLDSVTVEGRNETARYRLGLLSMMRRDYQTAIAELTLARAADPDHEGIRKALGYSYLWAGRMEEAMPLLHGLRQIEQELQAYTTWWAQRDRDDLAARASDMRERLRNAAQSN